MDVSIEERKEWSGTKREFVSVEHELLHEINPELPKFALHESLEIAFLNGDVPVLRWEGSALLSQLSDRGRELLSQKIEEFYTRKLVADVEPAETEACGSGECCGSNF